MLTFLEFVKLNKSMLNEMSFQSEMYSIKIINYLFKPLYNLKIERVIESKFPVDDTNIKVLRKCCNFIETITRRNKKNLKESFLASDDYALTILNKYFTSTFRIKQQMKKFLFRYIKIHKVTDLTIKDLYDKFHSTFPDKPLSDS